jgi:hypothetical protein
VESVSCRVGLPGECQSIHPDSDGFPRSACVRRIGAMHRSVVTFRRSEAPPPYWARLAARSRSMEGRDLYYLSHSQGFLVVTAAL